MGESDFDALFVATLFALSVVTLLALAQILTVGVVDQAILVLLVGAVTPIIPAFLARRRNGNGRK